MLDTDHHVHTTLSCDGHATMDELCAAAPAAGLVRLGFAEHVDHHPADEGCGFFDPDAYDAAIAAARAAHPGLAILKGIEFDAPHRHPHELAELLPRHYDFVIGAVHWIDDCFIGQPELKEAMTGDAVVDRYLDEVAAAVAHGGFHVLAHLDLPRRYGYPVGDHPRLPEILAAVVAGGIVLEINTSSLRTGCDEPLPGRAIIDAYITAGGRRVTVGADTHRIEHLGCGYEVAEAILAERPTLESGWFEGGEWVPGLTP